MSSSFQICTPGQRYSRYTSGGNIAKRKEKYHKRDGSNRSQMLQILGRLEFSGINSTVGVCRPFPVCFFLVSFRRHSICENRLAWIVLGLKTNYWQRGYGTWTVIRGNKNFTDGYFKLLADSAMTQLPSQRECELGTWECRWLWRWPNSGSQRQTVAAFWRFETNERFSFRLKYSVCRMCLAKFLPLKTNNQDCKQKKVDNRWKNKLKTFHGLFYKTSNPF